MKIIPHIVFAGLIVSGCSSEELEDPNRLVGGSDPASAATAVDTPSVADRIAAASGTTMGVAAHWSPHACRADFDGDGGEDLPVVVNAPDTAAVVLQDVVVPNPFWREPVDGEHFEGGSPSLAIMRGRTVQALLLLDSERFSTLRSRTISSSSRRARSRAGASPTDPLTPGAA
jgi:hypothetical protein